MLCAFQILITVRERSCWQGCCLLYSNARYGIAKKKYITEYSCVFIWRLLCYSSFSYNYDRLTNALKPSPLHFYTIHNRCVLEDELNWQRKVMSGLRVCVSGWRQHSLMDSSHALQAGDSLPSSESAGTGGVNQQKYGGVRLYSSGMAEEYSRGRVEYINTKPMWRE